MKPSVGVLVLQPLAGHRHDQVVGDQVAGVHVGLRLHCPSAVSSRDVSTQHLAGRDERQLEVVPEAVGLRSLARARGSEQDQV